jgi:hypothetical protein
LTTETLPEILTQTTAALLKMAREMTWNTISDQVCYVIRKTNPGENGNLIDNNRMRKRLLDAAPVLTPDQAVEVLRKQYPNLYLIELYVFKALQNRTIVEIALLEKDQLETNYRLSVAGNPPEWHCKVAIPPYRTDAGEKFDIHWPIGPWEFRWKMFWRKIK